MSEWGALLDQKHTGAGTPRFKELAKVLRHRPEIVGYKRIMRQPRWPGRGRSAECYGRLVTGGSHRPLVSNERPSKSGGVRLQPKTREYLTCGVAFVWVVDPDERRALCYTPADPGGALVDDLRTSSPDLQIPLAELFAALT